MTVFLSALPFCKRLHDSFTKLSLWNVTNEDLVDRLFFLLLFLFLRLKETVVPHKRLELFGRLAAMYSSSGTGCVLHAFD